MILNFKPHFKDMILSGKKDQTIRRVRKRRPIVVGDTLHFYTGARTKEAEEFARTECINTAPIVIDHGYIKFDGVTLDLGDQIYLAMKDGFNGVSSFKQFFEEHYGLPFHGVMIQWEPLGTENKNTQEEED